VVLQVESPRREEFLDDMIARKAVSRGVGEVTGLLPEPAVELGPSERDAEDPQRANLSFALLITENNVPEATSRLASADLGFVEQAILVELARTGGPSYNVRVLGLWTTAGNTGTRPSSTLTPAPFQESLGGGEGTASGAALAIGLSITVCFVCCFLCTGAITAYVWRGGAVGRTQRTSRVVAPVQHDGAGFADIHRAPGDNATHGELADVPKEFAATVRAYQAPELPTALCSYALPVSADDPVPDAPVTSQSAASFSDAQPPMPSPDDPPSEEQQGPVIHLVSSQQARRLQSQDPVARTDIHSIKVVHANAVM